MKLRYIYILLAFSLLFACQRSDNLSPEKAEHYIPLAITVGEKLTSRAAPPDSGSTEGGTEIEGHSEVDQVRVIGFKRKKQSSESFKYDTSNDLVLDCKVENGIRTARGLLKKEAQYDYQVIAIGYTENKTYNENWDSFSKKVESQRFSFSSPISSETTLDEFQLLISTQQEDIYKEQKISIGSPSNEKVGSLRTPELFYGYCHSGDEQKIITGTNDISLEGVLYRTMGRVNITITNIYNSDHKFHWMALFGDSVTVTSQMTSYDDFKKPSTPNIPKGWRLLQTYKLKGSNYTNQNPGQVKFSINLLPTNTKLKIRVFTTDPGILLTKTDEVKDYPLRFTELDNEGTATGIISPVASGEILYVKRNKEYNIKGTYQDLIK